MVDALFADFAAEGDARLTRDGVPATDRRMLRSADLRYHGQSFELSVTVPPSPLSAADIGHLCAEFHASHDRAYGYAAHDDPVELVNVRLAAVGVTPKPRRAPLPEGGRSAAAAVKGRRDVVAEASGFGECSIAPLLRGNVIEGLRSSKSTTPVHSSTRADGDGDEHANLVLQP
jgi:N-methylhydantoinase A